MKKNNEQIKKMVREKYAQIADQSQTENQSSCCGSTSCCETDYTIFSEDYSALTGYQPEADLGLGCGLPTEYAGIKEGDTVVDLGSGAGNDCFVARSMAGESGFVIGIDMTSEMIEKARKNAEKLHYTNVQFLFGDIENIPLEDNIADVVISNCVLNLVPDKVKAFTEIYRILKPGGHLTVSDVVLQGKLPDNIRNEAEMYAGCVSGAVGLEEYLGIMNDSGFQNIQVQTSREIRIPNEILLMYMTLDGLRKFKQTKTGIFSKTFYAEKPIS